MLLIHPGTPGLHGQELDNFTRSLMEHVAFLLGVFGVTEPAEKAATLTTAANGYVP